MIEKREHWFSEWLQQAETFSVSTVTAFHEFGGEGNQRTDLLMNRDGLLRTVSITCMELFPGRAVMYYRDMVSGAHSVNEWPFVQT